MDYHGCHCTEESIEHQKGDREQIQSSVIRISSPKRANNIKISLSMSGMQRLEQDKVKCGRFNQYVMRKKKIQMTNNKI